MITQLLRQSTPSRGLSAVRPAIRSSGHAYHQLKRAPIPLLQQPTRVRFSSYAPQLVLHSQVRAISIGTITRTAFSALRWPGLIVGTAATGVTVANNKLEGTGG